MKYEIESTRCVDCGIDTMKNGYVNRCHYNDNVVDAYHCGSCQSNIEWYVLGDSAYDKCESDEDVAKIDQKRDKDPDWFDKHCDEEAYDKYLEERIKEVDEQDPEAKAFRELCQSSSDCF